MANDAAAPDGELKELPSKAEQTEAEADSAAAEPESTAIELDASDAESTETEHDADADEAEEATAEEKPAKPPMSHVRLATIAGLVLVLALGGLTGWLGFRAYESRKAEEQRNCFFRWAGRAR